MEEHRIYVRCLAAYNSGYLHGAWIDASTDVDDMKEAIQKLLETSPMEDAEEWAIHDHQGFGNSVGEYTGLEKIAELVEFLEEHDEFGFDLLDNFHGDVDAARSAAEEYAGEYDDLGCFAEELHGDTSDIPSNLINYIDWDKMGRDLELGGDVFTIDNGGSVHVFWNH